MGWESNQGGEVVIVGAGLAGLSCAAQLEKLKIKYTILEAGTRIGGRATSDNVDGYTVDIGFQVYAESYPEGRRLLDYNQLEFQSFYSGIYVQNGPDRADRKLISDPRRYPDAISELIRQRLVTTSDLWTLLSVGSKLIYPSGRRRVKEERLADLLGAVEDTTFVGDVLVPFLQAVFLEDVLDTKLDTALFVLKSFLTGNVSVPLRGMSAISEQIARRLSGEIRLNSRVLSISEKKVTLEDGTSISGDAVIVATDASSANSLLGWPPSQPGRSVGYFYFRAEERPLDHAAVFTPGTRFGPILTVATISDVAPSYSPDNSHLISVSCTANSADNLHHLPTEAVYRELLELFGPSVAEWEEVAAGVIPNALPTEFGSSLLTTPDPKLGASIFVCGDYTETPSINGALYSGRRAAVAVADLLLSGKRHFEPLVGG